MGELILLVIVIFSVTSVIVGAKKARMLWSQAADNLGLPLVSPQKIAGARNGFPVRVFESNENVIIEIDLNDKVPKGICLASARVMTRSFSRALTPGVDTGDAAFDDKARIFGPKPYLLAMLDIRAREQVLWEVVSFGATVADGQMRRLSEQLGEAVVAVPELIELAGRLVVPEQEISERLAQNALSDPVAGARLCNLRMLIEHTAAGDTLVAGNTLVAGEALVAGTCRQLLTDDTAQSELRLEAAGYLQEEGLDELRALSMQDQIDAELRVRAIDLLARKPWSGRTALMLETLLAEPSLPPEVLLATIAALGRLGHAAATPRMLELAGQEADPRVSAEIAGALGRIGDPSSEPVLIELLAADDAGTQLAAAGALARVGSAAAVEPLLGMTSNRLASRALKKEAKAAVVTIQERLVGAEAGQLSMAVVTGLEGALSRDQSPVGALSLDSSRF